MISERHEYARYYAQHGIPVFPLHHPTKTGKDAACSCGKPCEFKRIGKHPRTTNGLKDATADIPTVDQWWTQWPEANIGMPTGPASRRWVLDIDLPNGPQNLEILMLRRGELTPNVIIRTGSGGMQYVFAWDDRHPIRNSTSALGNHLDVRGDGGYVILPPSLHATGGTYLWEE